MKYVLYAVVIAGVLAGAWAMREPAAEECTRLVEAQSINEAVEPCKQAAQEGTADAQYILGVMLASGEGMKRDLAEAATWYKKAAQQGHVVAQYNLGHAYHNARGVEQDFHQAFKWYRAAAEKGYADAQHNLGLAYLSGEGAPADPSSAYAWFAIAASQGQPLAVKARDLLKDKLTPVQLDEANMLVDAYHKQ